MSSVNRRNPNPTNDRQFDVSDSVQFQSKPDVAKRNSEWKDHGKKFVPHGLGDFPSDFTGVKQTKNMEMAAKISLIKQRNEKLRIENRKATNRGVRLAF